MRETYLREIAIRPWGTGSAALGLPNDDPMGNLDVLTRTGPHSFRRVRKDGALSSEYVFDMGADGRAVRVVRDNDILLRIEAIRPPTPILRQSSQPEANDSN